LTEAEDLRTKKIKERETPHEKTRRPVRGRKETHDGCRTVETLLKKTQKILSKRKPAAKKETLSNTLALRDQHEKNCQGHLCSNPSTDPRPRLKLQYSILLSARCGAKTLPIAGAVSIAATPRVAISRVSLDTMAR
jgi:hypothetical protein